MTERIANPMKKTALSLFVIAASGAYVWSQAGDSNTADPLLLGADPQQTGSIHPQTVPAAAELAPITPKVVPFVTPEAAVVPVPSPTTVALPEPPPLPPLPAAPEPQTLAEPTPTFAAAVQPAEPAPTVANVPMPRPRPVFSQAAPAPQLPTPIRVAATTGYADGTYVGPVTDAYYGMMQIQAIIQGGRLTAIKVLQYPSDRRTSVFINRQALPMLRDEVVRAQSARVDIISGATLSSQAFIRSLAGALGQARTS